LPDRVAVFARLRRELDVRACEAQSWGRDGRFLATGLAGIDEVSGGGLLRGAVTELVCAKPSCGGQLLLARLLEVTRLAQQRVALIDGSDAFDPPSHLEEDLYRHLVWVRCRSHAVALQAVDLVVRDANFGLVVLDLKQSEERELRRTPAAAWYRLQRAVEGSALVLLVKTPCRAVPSAQLRIELPVSHSFDHLRGARSDLLAGLRPVVQRQRRLLREVRAG